MLIKTELYLQTELFNGNFYTIYLKLFLRVAFLLKAIYAI